jgi:hypothetical protein
MQIATGAMSPNRQVERAVLKIRQKVAPEVNPAQTIRTLERHKRDRPIISGLLDSVAPGFAIPIKKASQ